MKDDLGPGWWQYEHWSSWFPFPEDHRRQDGATDRCEEVANCKFCYNYCYYLGRITHLQWQCWCVALDILPDTEKPIRTRNDKSGAIFVKLWQAHFFLCLFCLKYQLNCRYFYFSRTELFFKVKNLSKLLQNRKVIRKLYGAIVNIIEQT